MKGYKVTYPNGATKFVSDENINKGTAQIPLQHNYKKGIVVERVVK